MKRILLSILISFVLIVIYLAITSIIFVSKGQNPAIVPYLDLPLRLPKFIYFYLFPPTAEDFSLEFTQKRIVLALSFFIINILLYSIPVYFVIWFIKGLRKPEPENEKPPSRPDFAGN